MHRSLFTSVLSVAWLAVLAPGIQAQELTMGEGAQVYAVTCGRCHNPRGPDERSDREWDVIMTHMRTRAQLNGRDARGVLRFLQASNPPEAGSAANVSMGPDSAGHGRKPADESGCVDCDSIGRYTAGNAGPGPDTVLTRRSLAYILTTLGGPKTDNPASVVPQVNLSPSERQAVLTYITRLARK